ncbi:MAG: HlyD family efflux transporter periplasmic adaptor subunit [Anaerolineae bacterium]|nr:HlyD family efflux transporter periplasmic adaptor subunit [Anaerolineae bacterium]
MREKSWKLIVISALIVLALIVSGCTQLGIGGTEEPTEEALTAPMDVNPVVNATGEVVPELWTVLSFSESGTLIELNIEEGDSVQAGDVIARLDDAELQAALDEAEANLVAAEANLAKTQAGPTEEEIEAARQSVNAANARVAAAVSRRDALYNEVTPQEITAAEQRVRDAANFLVQSQGQLSDIEQFDPYWCKNYDAELGQECPAGFWPAYQDRVDVAQLDLAAAQAYLETLQDGPEQSRVDVENARIYAASTSVMVAQAQLDLLLAQPFPEEIMVAEAKVEQAQAGIDSVQAKIDKLTLTAPFAGTVTDVPVDASEFVGAGQVIAKIGDLEGLQVETTDLSEIDVARIAVGSTANVEFDALPEEGTTGVVTRINPKSDEGAGVNYTVIIELDNLPENLRWGMTAFVDIDVVE